MIGIVGATGEVGSHAVRTLRTLGLGPLRTGGSREVDYRDETSLDRFAEGCRVLVNCAGPARLVGDRVAQAAARAGADHVDASEPEGTTDDGRVVLGAGLRPGLTGVLPRWLARREFDTVHGLVAHLGVLDRFTRTAADDYLAAVGDGEALAAWRHGKRPGVLTRRTGMTLPFFPGEVSLLPYLDAENVRMAEELGLAKGDWYSVVSGEHVRAAFDRVHSLGRADAVAALCRAGELDLAGREPYVVLTARMDGVRAGEPVTRTAVLRGRGNGALTGALTALAVLAVIRREVPEGRRFAADVLDPEVTIGRLAECGVAEPFVVDGVPSVEVGAL
ncbi:hypothetical protein SD37_10165 [Amycolatopsis orientalis]|uniref:Saccharopine dehydrogenase NADP binding domain-containing protein n=1 Tax=Amycolatopsis orientalis TaxID=31958 RepID=A0A193BUW4_AMYOR|nr:hypothetical protein [Amycolatopsis orientalis]ANN15970.1 hypothetical protein SD37_10165 [Amycolatopsis orientalis]